jgi:putative ABC transport system permease protein
VGRQFATRSDRPDRRRRIRAAASRVRMPRIFSSHAAAARQREIAPATAPGRDALVALTRQLLPESVLLASIAAVGGLPPRLRWHRCCSGDSAHTTVPAARGQSESTRRRSCSRHHCLGQRGVVRAAPRVRASRSDERPRRQGRRARDRSGGPIGHGVRSALVVAEISISLVLLVGRGSHAELRSTCGRWEVGFDPRGLAVVPIRLPQATYPDPERVSHWYFQDAIGRVRQLPGVTAARRWPARRSQATIQA